MNEEKIKQVNNLKDKLKLAKNELQKIHDTNKKYIESQEIYVKESKKLDDKLLNATRTLKLKKLELNILKKSKGIK